MSHFAVLVVTKTGDKADLAAALQPFHEFECTGIEDQYVVDVDKTDEALAKYAEATTVRLKGPDGTLHDRFTPEGEWKPQFSRKGTLGQREGYVPPGYESVEVPAKNFETAAEWIHGYYGWPISGVHDGDGAKYGRIEVDGEGNVVRCVDRTNPNAHWDWWVIGGRFKGMLRTRAKARAVVGEAGLMGARYSDQGVDACMRGDLDLATMRADAVARRLQNVRGAYEKVREKNGALGDAQITAMWGQFCTLRADLLAQWEANRNGRRFWDFADQNAEFKALHDLGIAEIGPWGFDGAYVPEQEPFPLLWAERAPPLSTFAFLGADGVWRERGEMGWWAMVSNEKPAADWEAEYEAAIDAAPKDHWVWIVDCHI
jgi:hypothetical protein